MIPEIRSTSIPSVRPQAQNAPPVAQAASNPTPNASDSVDIRPQSSLDRLLATTAPEASRLEADLGEHVPGEVLVKLKSHPLTKSQGTFAQRFGATVLERFDFPKDIYKNFTGEMLHLKLPEGMTTAQALAAMQQDPRVEYVIPNNIYTLDDPPAENTSASSQGASADAPKTPNDLKPELWGLHNTGQKGGTPDADIDAPEAWAVTTGNPNGPLIAVIDTGVDYNHPDLVNNIWTNPGEIPGDGIDNDGNGVIDDVHGYNAYAQTGDPMDGHSHGTHCAGTIAAEGNNDQGVVGVNWRARIMPVKIFSDAGSTNSAAIVRGILYATKNGARVTSNSWGGGAADPAIREAFANSPALHIMAAGNSGTNNDARPHYPSSYDLTNNIAVAASDRNDRLAGFSCYGEKSVDIAAPGVEIYSTIPGGGYANKSGTSMATPHVAGAAGLLLASDPNMSNDELKTRLLEGADKLDSLQGKVATGARLNIANAIAMDYEATEKPNV
ncbi:MAG: S8 family peptidase [Candidatus Xenobium sp.]|jgi:subtilisin family serine protease|nr:S8 family serine peptidase [Burkholderiales bacterium]